MDQPTIDGINVWFVSKAARELGLKVAISGLGGDELFGGYSSFRDLPTWVRWMAAPSSIPFLGQVLRRAFRRMHGEKLGVSPKVAGLVEFGGSYPGAYLLRRGLFMPWELPDVLDPELAREGLKQLDPINHIACTLMPDPVQPFARVATLEVLLVHAQSAAAGHRLGEHGAFAGGPCAARRCRAVRKTRGHGARHRSAECQASIAGCVQRAGGA